MSDPEELARTLRATARTAATGALREGLEEIETRHGQHIADEVAGLLDVDGVFAGLRDTENRRRGSNDDVPWEFKTEPST
ncbi:hypothetical protein [Amycolatopsis sp. BJA-103]|uniref:hypothetical protein n=1 Tax=unclassified Amycolatopsis TaxID=2618356 RepID=UPI000C76A143|nr:hypothetical protein [Amycolatopsis sp. BJA-103]AUI59598.1 hypothetical protein BKN51_16135 [Amycolatopsis sp. BJA-103]PNE16954.1 hypothetical protein B1H26_18370 [Amycolatopsis sp. BJA-103]